ncbi:DUF3152 domain-containing protein [Acidimicrobiia bacterium EGI L10123]|uniref:DUF3152 domain-containing protein n=1 Tax=Salinilacustrithrix flava TaxID=2957203 RepID=UPI003D7C345D|nr:DUF3152 domain-containing protein [Acidimicrobiia bacterium EGI L10123]
MAAVLAAAGCGGDGDVIERAETTTTPAPTSTTVAETTTSEPDGPVVIEVRTERRATEGTDGFAQIVRDTLADPRGWSQAGFEIRITDDAPNVVLVAEGDEVDAICDPYDTGGRFSCQIGPVVALNADRWREATDTWPGTLEEYRQMLVNHEVGHLLGRHHARPACQERGTPAAVMYQQSAGVEGCAPNPWPLPWEIACAARHDEPVAPPYEPDATATCGPDDV